MIAAGVMAGLLALMLSYGLIALKAENRYIVGIMLTILVTMLFMIPVVIYSDRF